MQPLQHPDDEPIHVPTIISARVGDPETFPIPVIKQCIIHSIEVIQVDRDTGAESIEVANVMQTSSAEVAGEEDSNDSVEYYTITRELKNSIFGKVYHALKLELVTADTTTINGLPIPAPPFNWQGGGAYRLREIVPHVQMAVKVYFKQRLREMTSKTYENPLAEFGAMQYLGLRNKYVMGQWGAYQDGDSVYSLMEFADGGELYDRVADMGHLEESEGRRFFLQILLGLEYCHSMGVAHRDMSLENVIHDRTSNTVKIIDFGMCIKVPRDEATGTHMYVPPQGRCGKKNYISPEVLQNNQNFNPMKSDIWALGVILFTMLTGFPPVDTATTADPRYRMISAGHLRTLLDSWNVNHLSNSAIDLMENILRPNPGDRLTLAEIRLHPWCVEGFASMNMGIQSGVNGHSSSSSDGNSLRGGGGNTDEVDDVEIVMEESG